jgi:hypothetical protein
MSCKGCGKPPAIKELTMYYEAARQEEDQAKKLTMALELCHELIIELSNHVYCMHGQECTSRS